MTTGRHRANTTTGRHRAAVTAGFHRYLADRGVVPALNAVLTVSVTVTTMAIVPDIGKSLEQWWTPVASIGPLLAVVFMMRTLAGDDVRLEQTVPRLRSRWRMVHALTTVALSAGLMLIVACSGIQHSDVWELVRNVFGLSGLALLTTPLLDAASAWAPTAGYTLFTLLTVPRDAESMSALWGWHLQPSAQEHSWLAAVALLTMGMFTYARRGPSP